MSPAATRYSVTTCDPGASDVFTQGFVVSPRSTAFLATRPAATSTAGFEVLVHDVIAESTTAPCASWNVSEPRVMDTLGTTVGIFEVIACSTSAQCALA